MTLALEKASFDVVDVPNFPEALLKLDEFNPDIAIDVSTNHREKLIQYVYQKYGEDSTAMVCTYVTFQARNAIREVGKVLGMPPAIVSGDK